MNPSAEPSQTAEAAAPTATLRLSGMPGDQHMRAMRDYLAGLMRVELDPLDTSRPMRYQATLRTVPGASWGSAWASAVSTTRTAPLCQDGQDDLMLVIPSVRMTVLPLGGQALRIGPGDAALVSQARPLRIVMEQDGPSWALRVPHADMARVLPRLGEAPMLALRATPMLGLLQRLGRLLESEPLKGAASQQFAARQLQDTLAVALGQSPDYAAWAEEYSLAAVRLRAVRADIASHLASSRLSLAWLAARQGISARQLQRVLASAGTSYEETLRHIRLQAARAMLQEPRNAGMSIEAIAHACGFSEASTLSRAFKQYFGMTPGEARWKLR
ncbi:MAG: helix-turn-helix transcriptional regulator [Acidovorax sp.]|nr:helix-turn-helix transcriptional regulator [Acidovorax sp.]